MIRHLAGRVGQAIVATFGVLTIVFFIMRLSGDPTLLLVPEGATAEQIAELRHELGLRPPVAGAIRRVSCRSRTSRSRRERSCSAPASLASSQSAFPIPWSSLPARSLVALGIGIPAGMAMAVWRGSVLERALAAFVLTGQSLPTFWSGILLILLFGVALGWLPTSGADLTARP